MMAAAPIKAKAATIVVYDIESAFGFSNRYSMPVMNRSLTKGSFATKFPFTTGNPNLLAIDGLIRNASRSLICQPTF